MAKSSPTTVLKMLRVEFGMSQAEVARRCGASTPTICRVERGSADCKRSTRDRLEELFGTDFGTLTRPFKE